jgi:endonuclease YncB( thermonuclease family)
LGDYLLTALVFGLLLLFISRMDELSTRSNAGKAQVNDGDTITIAGERMRLRGIDAPEYTQNCKLEGRDYACGREARRRLEALVNANPVTCRGWERDKYQRLLVVCQAGGAELNAEMVRLGWAVSFGGYKAEESEARTAKRGIWRGEFVAPQDWRASHQPHNAEAVHGAPGSFFNWLRQLIWPQSPS